MKRLLIFFHISIFAFCSCRKEDEPVTFVKTPDYKKAESFLKNNQNDSSFYYFNQIAATSKDSFQTALAYTNMGLIQFGSGDYYGCQESLLLSLTFLDDSKKEHRACLASNYNELGLSSSQLQNYDIAISFYERALKFSDHKSLQLIILNNKALAHQKKKNYAEALKIYETILKEAEKGGTEYARILSNMARTRWLFQSRYNARPAFLTALSIRIKNNDLWGQNASYAHLAEYYAVTNPDSALFYAEKRYTIARRLNSPDDLLLALERLIKLGPPAAAKQYFPVYQQLSDSIQTARNAAKNQFALIRYEAEKNKADNLKLQKENTEKKYQLVRQRALLYLVIILVVAGSIIVILWYRKRKQQHDMEIRNTIREHQLKTSQKVHDVVANGLYRIMTEIEHSNKLHKEQLLDKIEILYQQSRDITYEKPEPADQNFHERISGLIKSFATEDIKILIAGNNNQLWNNVSGHILDQVGHILQELMVNMTKHSRAGAVVIRFTKEAQNITIYYTDDGIGLPAGFRKGNGIVNTENRIKAIGGSIKFDANTGKGLKIRISFPIA